ncbi:MAG: DUF1854 domain-containing protein [Deltaproteobacteria bacterium]|nr:DUF1854 domain-containing protein [Deltaproteobacteria bacterium]
MKLAYDAFRRLVLYRAGEPPVVGVVPVRAFPFTAPRRHISLCDAQGREVHAIASLDELEPADAAMITAELARRELLPGITAIHSISPDNEPSVWQVATDRGPITFVLPSEDSIRRLGEHGALIADAHGVRYRIADARTLDKKSRTYLERYL